MTFRPKPFDVDALISLEGEVQRDALEAFFQGIIDSGDTERNEVVRFAYRVGWRVLPEILADDSPDFFKPIKRYVFAASCRALFAATHPDADARSTIRDVYPFARPTVRAAEVIATAKAIKAATRDTVYAARAEAATHGFDDAAFAVNNNNTLRQPLLLAMREDLFALHTNQTLADSELWPKESASLLDVDGWFGTFRTNLKRYQQGPEITDIYEALLSGRIEKVIREYPPDLFEDFFKSAESDYQEWERGHAKDDEEPPAGETKKSPRDTLHSEGPSQTDHLDRDSLVEVLCTWLNKSQTHKAIGLFGDWGVGKSTFVNLLRKRLGIPLDDEAADSKKPPPDYYKTANYIGGEFNAWQYEHTDNIQAGLAQELIAALQANLSWREKAWLTWRYHSVDWFLTAVFVLVFVSISNFVFYAKDVPWFSGLISISGLVGIGSLLAAFRCGANAITHPLAKKLRTYLRLPSFVKELGTIPVMREQVKAMVNLRLNFFKQQRLLFVVDDLDRCSPEAVVKVLEAVRLIMDLSNVVVLIAIDHKIALASLASRYEELAIHYGTDPKSIARQYLGKVVHVPITLDNPAPEAVENYLLQKLWAADDASETTSKEARPDDKLEGPDGHQPAETTKSQTTTPASPGDDDPSANAEHSPETSKTSQTPEKPEAPTAEPSTPVKSSYSEAMYTQPEKESIGLSKGQKDTFMIWAKKLGLANPRHIKRLDNAYNLIRMRYPDEDKAGEPYYRLLMLMWIEYSRELQLDTYAASRNYVRAEMVDESDDTIKRFRNQLDNYDRQVGLLWDEVKAVWEEHAGETPPDAIREAMDNTYLQVCTFVLPAIEKDNTKSKKV